MRWMAKMTWVASQARDRRRGVALVVGVALVALLCAGGTEARASASPTATIASPATPTSLLPSPTATSGAPCASIGDVPGTATTLTIPLPPGTRSQTLPSAAGAGFTLECTPGATQASITSYLNTALPHAGWQKWNPQKDDAHGCGTEPNDIWQWYNSQVDVGWVFHGPTNPALPPLPVWMLSFCSRAYGA